ncbi:hypothetical protein EMPS_04261 [Entomortierella parvispora]|uniref:Uncharacterized protein n=1 Tax=Entomortierella parvispora TaxID=205924 RepID=A0A9P3LVE5_9FUNG|nr:hypothetical protein EMPS_04261 [Entomortierella parvispora]
MDSSSSLPKSPSTTTTAPSPRSSSAYENMQPAPSKTPPTSRLYFLLQTTPPPPTREDSSSSAMDVDTRETDASSSYAGVRFQPGTRSPVQTRPRPPLTPRRPCSHSAELSILGRPRKLDLGRPLHQNSDDRDVDPLSRSGTMRNRSESETEHTKPNDGRHTPESSSALRIHSHPWDSGDDGHMDLDMNSPWSQDNIKEPHRGSSSDMQNKRLSSLERAKKQPLVKALDSRKRVWQPAKDPALGHGGLSASSVDDDDGRTDEDEFWDPKVDDADQRPAQLHPRQWSAKRVMKSAERPQAPSRLQHLLKTTTGRTSDISGTSSVSKSEGHGYGDMLKPPFLQTSIALWHRETPCASSASSVPSPFGNVRSQSVSQPHGSPYPPFMSWTRENRTAAIAGIRRGKYSAATPTEAPASSRLSSLPLPAMRVIGGQSSRYEIVALRTPGSFTPRRYAVEDESTVDRDWPSSPLAGHSLQPDKKDSRPISASSHAPTDQAPPAHLYRSCLSKRSPSDGEEDQKEVDHLDQECHPDNISNLTFSGGVRGYMTPKRSSSSSTPPRPPIRNRNVRTRIAPLQDAPPRFRDRWSPSDSVQSPCSRKLNKQPTGLPMSQRGMVLHENEPLNKKAVFSRLVPPKALNYDSELETGKCTASDLDPCDSAVLQSSSTSTDMTVRLPLKPADTNISSFGVTTE